MKSRIKTAWRALFGRGYIGMLYVTKQAMETSSLDALEQLLSLELRALRREVIRDWQSRERFRT